MYPLGVNTVFRKSNKFPIIFDVRTEINYKGLSDLCMSSGAIPFAMNEFRYITLAQEVERGGIMMPHSVRNAPRAIINNWYTDANLIRFDYTKIQNDIPLRPLPPTKQVPTTANYEWRAFNTEEQRNRYVDHLMDNTLSIKMEEYILRRRAIVAGSPLLENFDTHHAIAPVTDIPDKIGKYWIKMYPVGHQPFLMYTPNYELRQNGEFKTLTLNHSEDFLNDSRRLRQSSHNPKVFNIRYEVYNKLPPLELPIQIRFRRVDQGYNVWEWNSSGNNYRRISLYAQESVHDYPSGTHPFYLNLGFTRERKHYWTWYTDLIESNEFTNDVNTVIAHNNDILSKGLYISRDDNLIANQWWSGNEVRFHIKLRFIYEFSYPREYGLRGIKFLDMVHEYKIDSFTKPTGNGTVTYDRFRVQLAYPMDSLIEITKEPTSWTWNRHKVRLRTNEGWVNSGSDGWGNSPIAQGHTVIGELPAGFRILESYRTLSPNTGTDKWIGYQFLVAWPYGDKVGIRMTQKPTSTLFRENVTDPNFSLRFAHWAGRDPNWAGLTDPNMRNKEYNLNPHLSYAVITIRDYNPQVVQLASQHRNASNRWSAYIYPIEFEMEFYLK